MLWACDQRLWESLSENEKWFYVDFKGILKVYFCRFESTVPWFARQVYQNKLKRTCRTNIDASPMTQWVLWVMSLWHMNNPCDRSSIKRWYWLTMGNTYVLCDEWYTTIERATRTSTVYLAGRGPKDTLAAKNNLKQWHSFAQCPERETWLESPWQAHRPQTAPASSNCKETIFI